MCRPSNRGSRHGARRRLAEQGGRVSGEGTCNQRSATCSASPLAGAQLSQVRRGDGSSTIERSPLAVQKRSVLSLRGSPPGAASGGGCFGLPRRRWLGAGRCLDEIVNDACGILPRRNFTVESCDFFPPFRGVLRAHRFPPEYASTALYHRITEARLCYRLPSSNARARNVSPTVGNVATIFANRT